MSELQDGTEKVGWTRFFYMVLFAFLFNAAEFVIYVIMIIQFFLNLTTGRSNDRLLLLGKNITNYVPQIIEYLTFVSDKKPYPFSPWPDNEKNTDE